MRDFADEVAAADCVVLGSYVPEGIRVAKWVIATACGVTAFYDIDTPVTLAQLARGGCEYLAPSLIPQFDFYLSFTGGPMLELIEEKYGAQSAHAFYCSVDPERYFPQNARRKWDLGYLGTYSADRQPALKRFLCQPAAKLGGERFVVAGPLYPKTLRWPENVERIHHLSPADHRAFYNAQRFTLNLTRRDMIRAGWSPSVRLFEAAACGVPIISDHWEGIENFFVPDSEILLADSSADVCAILRDLPETERLMMGKRARRRVLAQHTAAHRAAELEELVRSAEPTSSFAPLEEAVS